MRIDEAEFRCVLYRQIDIYSDNEQAHKGEVGISRLTVLDNRLVTNHIELNAKN